MTLRPPISDRIRSVVPELEQDHPELFKELMTAERIATGQFAYASINGRHPKDWSFDRWIQVGLLVAAVTVAFRWANVERNVQALQETTAALVETQSSSQTLTNERFNTVNLNQRALIAAVEAVSRELGTPGPRVTFPREEQFVAP